MKKEAGALVFSPSDLIRYSASPFSSWMDRYHLENSGAVHPDEESEDQKLVAQSGDQHEQATLAAFRAITPDLVGIPQKDSRDGTLTKNAMREGASMIYQAALRSDRFAGFADFLIMDDSGQYQVWDTKLARSPRPYFIVQLCCYSEMLAATAGVLPTTFGVILGTKEKVTFSVEDFIHYYRCVKAAFLRMQDSFSGDLMDRPEPAPRADHGRWASYAERYFLERDHLVQVARITVGQIKKLKAAGIVTMAALSEAEARPVPKLGGDSLRKLAAQARLQRLTRDDRKVDPDAVPRFEILPHLGGNSESVGLGCLPASDLADVYFDMEGYPMVPGGLEYLFGASFRDPESTEVTFKDWWAHDRAEEKVAFEGFIDWVYDRWRNHPAIHIYHYAAYEVSAIRRLSTSHDTRQDQVDDLLRNEVFVDLYKIVGGGLRIGESSYSLKKVESLYRPRRVTDVATAAASIVEYARWKESGESRNYRQSGILRAIRDYNEDDCLSTLQLVDWLRTVVAKHGIPPRSSSPAAPPPTQNEEVTAKNTLIAALREQGSPISVTLADLVDFHRREQKPMWWRMFERAQAGYEELRDDPGCIFGLQAVGNPVTVKRSCVQAFRFDPNQECKLAAGDSVMFTHDLETKFKVDFLDNSTGDIRLKLGNRSLDTKCGGAFPRSGSVLQDEFVSTKDLATALNDVGTDQLRGHLPSSVGALLQRLPAADTLQDAGETTLAAAIRVTKEMKSGCLVIQGPPGTGKTYTAAMVIARLVAAGKRVGITSNSHKAIGNLLSACAVAIRRAGYPLKGVKVGSEGNEALAASHPGMTCLPTGGGAREAYAGGVAAGTAWLFSRPEWKDSLDFLFIDEAGQVPLANAAAVARCAENLVLLGDQMQLEQPIQGSHPGGAGLSVLQYALKDTALSLPDAPIFHAVVPSALGIFLNESRRMHPDVCEFISGSIYEGRLRSFADCAKQRIALPPDGGELVKSETGIVFSGVEHDGNIQHSEEEVDRIHSIYAELVGRTYFAADGTQRPLGVADFLIVAPYNAQVRALQRALPAGARVGSVDKFQGQEAPVCILSMCSSYGEYGSRGLAFILDRNRVNVAITRAKCLAIIVADPRIASSQVASIEEMRLLNLFCKIKAWPESNSALTTQA